MGENSKIEWTDHTFNPWRGCNKVSPGCKFCYAENRANRYGEEFSGRRIVLAESGWKQPIKWNNEAKEQGVRHKVFCASLADVFEDKGSDFVFDHHGNRIYRQFPEVTRPSSDPVDHYRVGLDHLRRDLFALIDVTPYLDWLVLTKRPENILRMWADVTCVFCGEVSCGLHRAGVVNSRRRDNVWIGTSVENQEAADKRIPDLLKCRDLSPVLFLSCEPLLGSVTLDRITKGPGDYLDCLRGVGFDSLGPWTDADRNFAIDWVIAGGESGPNARPMHPIWVRGLRDQCDTAGVPFHFKQWGEWHHYNHHVDRDFSFDDGQRMWRIGKSEAGRVLDGREWNEFPKVNQ